MEVNNINDSLSAEILYYIFGKLKSKDLNNCEAVCKLWNQVITENPIWKKLAESQGHIIPKNNDSKEVHKYSKKVYYVEKLMPEIVQFPQTLIDAFGGKYPIYLLPKLDIGNTNRDYLDFIDPDKMTAPVMRGADIRKRLFIVFKYNMYKDGNKTIVATEAIFQRDPKASSHWCSGSRPSGLCNITNKKAMLEEKNKNFVIACIQKLMKGEAFDLGYGGYGSDEYGHIIKFSNSNSSSNSE